MTYQIKVRCPETPDADDLCCPRCQSNNVNFKDEVFVEAGEYDEGEQRYEVEYDAKRYECGDCSAEFIL